MHRRDTAIWFVAAVARHSLRVGESREWRLHCEPGYFAHALDQRLDGLEYPLLLREGHFQIDLCELRLPVRAEIFVAEAAHNLKIFLEAAHHKDLFKDLRRLRQRVERP